MKTKRTLTGLLGLLLCLAMIVGMLPMIPTVSAVTDTAKKGCCTADHTGFTSLGTEGATSPVQVSREDLKNGGNYRLVSDVEITVGGVSLSSGSDLHIDLNGFTISTKKTGIIFDVYATLTLCDTSDEQTGKLDASSLSTSDGAVYIRDGGTFEFHGGTISGVNRGTSTKKCVAIYMAAAGSTVKMHGGKITGNSSNQGPAVYMNAGTFTMSGGEISGNTATGEGGAIYSKGTVTISGGKITGNHATNTTDDTDKAGAIYVTNGTLTMHGGTISGNSAGNRYQAIYVGGSTTTRAAFTMTGGNITANNPDGSSKGFGSVGIGDGVDCTITGASVINDDGIWVRNEQNDAESGNTVTIKELMPGANIVMLEAGDVDTIDSTVVAPATFPGVYTYKSGIVSRMVLGNALDMQFAIPASVMEEVAEVKIGEKIVSVDEVIAEGKDYAGYSIVTCKDIAAKKMADEVTVTVTDKNGKIVEQKTDSVKAYAMRLLDEKTEKDKVATLLVDMLNYGAAAQTEFGYNTDKLANADLGEKAQWATQARTYVDATEGQGTAALVLGNTIDLRIEVADEYKNSKLAYSFKNHRGQDVTGEVDVQIDDSDAEDIKYYVAIETIALADRSQLVTVKSGDKVVGQDSVESYVARMQNVGDLYAEIMKFADSAYAYFH